MVEQLIRLIRQLKDILQTSKLDNEIHSTLTDIIEQLNSVTNDTPVDQIQEILEKGIVGIEFLIRTTENKRVLPQLERVYAQMKNALGQLHSSSGSLNPDQPLAVTPLMPGLTRKTAWLAAAVYGSRSPFFDPKRMFNLQIGLRHLLRDRELFVRFSNRTGLPRTIRGKFGIQAGSIEEIVGLFAGSFLEEHSMAFTGDRAYDWAEPSRIGLTVRVQQIVPDVPIENRKEAVPIYGATVSGSFNDELELHFISNGAYPFRAYEPQPFEFSQESAADIAVRFIGDLLYQQNNSIQQLISKYWNGQTLDQNALQNTGWNQYLAGNYQAIQQYSGLSKEFIDENLTVVPHPIYSEGHVILPLVNLTPEKQERQSVNYYSAWVFYVVIPTTTYAWEVAVDATSGGILAVAEATVHATQQVYDSNTNALENKLNNVECTVDNFRPEFMIHAGSPGAYTLFNNCEQLPDLRVANLWYHLSQAAAASHILRKDAWPSAPEETNIPIPGLENNKIYVYLNESVSNGTAKYTHTIANADSHFGTLHFNQAGNNYEDPAFDHELIAHEYSHAFLHKIQPDLFLRFAALQTIGLPYERFHDSINEAIAFYFGISLGKYGQQAQNTGNATPIAYQYADFWGRDQLEVYQLAGRDKDNWRAGYEKLATYGQFPNYTTTDLPSGNEHRAGLLWARILWALGEIQNLKNLTPIDAAILRAVNMVTGLQSEFESQAEAIMTVVIDRLRQALSPAELAAIEANISASFIERGVMANAPIHDLEWLNATPLGMNTSVRYVLAATEPSPLHPGGCLIRDSQTGQWQSLGQNGPLFCTSVAKVIRGNNLHIWAVGGDKPGEGAIHLYEYVTTIEQAEWDLNWDKTSGVAPDAVVDGVAFSAEIYDIAPLPSALGAPSFYMGSEIGFHHYDQAGVSAPLKRLTPPVFSVSTVPIDGERSLIICIQNRPDNALRIFRIDNDAPEILTTVEATSSQLDRRINQHLNGIGISTITSAWLENASTLYVAAGNAIVKYNLMEEPPGSNKWAFSVTGPYIPPLPTSFVITSLCLIEGSQLWLGTAHGEIYHRALNEPPSNPWIKIEF